MLKQGQKYGSTTELRSFKNYTALPIKQIKIFYLDEKINDRDYLLGKKKAIKQ